MGPIFFSIGIRAAQLVINNVPKNPNLLSPQSWYFEMDNRGKEYQTENTSKSNMWSNTSLEDDTVSKLI